MSRRRVKLRFGVMQLPIDDVLPQLRSTLRDHPAAVLVAPPGAGKTTRVPLALHREDWLRGGRVVLLEPRRLAARAAAHRMATLLGEEIGATVGLRVRHDSRVSARTRIEVVTEGVLARMIATDPTLEDLGLVIFDEFHERSLHADLGLALTLHARELLRPDLRVLVMSATLDAAQVARLLGDAPVVHSAGTSYPVRTEHLPPRSAEALAGAVRAAIRRALDAERGDILVFLPGAREIHDIADALQRDGLPPGCYVVPLYGAMPLADQDRAIAPSSGDARKIVLATSIAQTSLTIEGVRVVIDSGLARVPRYAPRSGMTRLHTVRVSRAAADQRRGRAGRVAPGVCYRLWDAADEAALRPFDVPEVLEADLASVALDLAGAGVSQPDELRWLDPPPAGAFAQARDLLRQLDALDGHGTLTAHGRLLASLGTHPRLGHMLLRAADRAGQALAADLIAILEERDVIGGPPHARDPDIRTRLALLHDKTASSTADRRTLARVRESAARWRSRTSVSRTQHADTEDAGVLLALAYPDRVAQRRAGEEPRYVLRNGTGARLPAATVLHREPYLVAAALDGRQPESGILLCAPITLDDIEKLFDAQIETRDVITWDDAMQAVTARRLRLLGAVRLSDDPLSDPAPDDVQRALLEAIVARGFSMLNWTRDAVALRQRLAFLQSMDPAWPDVSDAGLAANADRWLTPHLSGLRRAGEVARIALVEALMQLLSWPQRRRLDELAPAFYVTASGHRARIDYTDRSAPVLAVRLQDMFGLTSTPAIAGGRVPLTLHLLAPNQRPVQVTRDLASFWRGAYQEVRRQLRARYPKHRWPEDPFAPGG
jgi:ATP-dependent helicase HrpB